MIFLSFFSGLLNLRQARSFLRRCGGEDVFTVDPIGRVVAVWGRLESGFLSVGKHRCFCVGAGVIF